MFRSCPLIINARLIIIWVYIYRNCILTSESLHAWFRKVTCCKVGIQVYLLFCSIHSFSIASMTIYNIIIVYCSISSMIQRMILNVSFTYWYIRVRLDVWSVEVVLRSRNWEMWVTPHHSSLLLCWCDNKRLCQRGLVFDRYLLSIGCIPKVWVQNPLSLAR